MIQSQQMSSRIYKSAIDCAIKKYKEDGIRIFFTGLTVTLLRSFIVNGIGLLSFEMMMRMTGRRKEQEEQYKDY